jgi:capsule polysaccharide export protein KpsE/RkpR
MPADAPQDESERIAQDTQAPSQQALRETVLAGGEPVGQGASAVEERLRELDARIAAFKARSDIVLLKVEHRYYCLINTLRAMEKRIEAMLAELRRLEGAHDPQWHTLKAQVDEAEDLVLEVLAGAKQELDRLSAELESREGDAGRAGADLAGRPAEQSGSRPERR